jgi:hypothetical protein
MMARKTFLPIAPFPPSFLSMRRQILLLNIKRNLRSDIMVNGQKGSYLRQEIVRIADRKLHPMGLQA